MLIKTQIQNNKESFFSSVIELLDLTNSALNPDTSEHEVKRIHVCENVSA